MTVKTKSLEAAADVQSLLRARNNLLVIVSREESRVERYLFEAAAAAGYIARFWDVAQGVTELGGKRLSNIGGAEPLDMLQYIAGNKGERAVWVMRDLLVWLAGIPGAPVLRQLRNFARTDTEVKDAQAIIIVSTSGDLPPELAAHATVIEWPLPDREEIGEILDAAVAPYKGKIAELTNGVRGAAIDAAVGLSGDEAASNFARSLVQERAINPATVAKEKKRVITGGGLEWYDPLPGGLDAVGGLDNLKGWLLQRSSAYSPAARAYGLSPPKGVFLVGVPGCGKTHTSKAISTAWQVPLIRWDFAAMKNKFLGTSEANFRSAQRTIEAVGRCVVWIDEIEKALAGATSGSADGGVSADQLGSFLTWMQERKGESFVIVTANDVEALPPELLRKGRFDEVFFVDLPTQEERVAVLKAALRANGRDADKLGIDVERVAWAAVSENKYGFTGSEIAAIVPDAMFAAFNDGGREITTDDLLKAAASVVPLAKTAEPKINKLRAWAQGKARPASVAEVEQKSQKRIRALDI